MAIRPASARSKARHERVLDLARRTAFIATCMLIGAMAQAQSTDAASLGGTLTDAAGAAPIAGASVQVAGVSAVTDSEGDFAIRNLPPGSQALVISAAGYQTLERRIDLVAGANKLAINLEPSAIKLDDMAVTAPSSEARSKFDDKSATDSLTELVFDPLLKSPNAQSGSDVVKDVSGVSVSKGANGSSNVSVRGVDQRMLRITIDGQRQGGTGNPLDNIPAEIVQSLEVTKTFTPDMDGDAVGGVININTGGTVMKEGYVQGRHQFGYNPLAPHPGTRNSLTIGQPFALNSEDRNASVLATLSFDDQYSDRERVSALREWTPQISPGPYPYTGLEVPVLTLPLIESTREHRQRTGLVLNSDARFGDLALFWRSNIGRDWARRDRSFNDTDPASGSPLALTPISGTFSGVPLSRRSQEQESQRDAGNFSVGGKLKTGRSDLDATFAYGLTREKEPNTLETGFLSDHTYRATYRLAPDPYAPDYEYIDETDAADTASAYDPTRYRINYLSITRGDLDETEGSAKLNVKINLQDGGNYLKFGAKWLQRRRTADIDRDFFDAGTQVRDMNGLVDRPLVSMDTLPYRFGPVPDVVAVARLLSSNPDVLEANSARTSINSNTGDYSVTEKSWALYGMGKIRFGQWAVLGGVRVEGTRVNSSGREMSLDTSGQLQGFADAQAANDYVNVLPGLHLRYEPKSGVLYRASITRSMSRPNNADIAPYRTLSFIDRRSRIGAPDLKPYLATNLDLSVDTYGDAYGLVSFAVFYKKIDHFITDAQYPIEIGDLGTFIEFKHVNGEAARAMGFEIGWQSPTRDLPFNLGRGSLEANYSFNHGEAHHRTRPEETFPLPRQVDQQASLKFHGERGPASFDTTVSYRSGWWEDLIAPGFDNYITSAWDAEISTAYKFGKNLGLTLGVSNLLDLPTRHYAGASSRMNDWQKNGVEMSLRAQWKK